MFVLGVAGSPRRNGNTEILLNEALSAARGAGALTEKVVLSAGRFAPCLGCGACEKTGNCIQKDDMQDLYEKITTADTLIFASPIYFYHVSSLAKSAIDRSQALWSRKYVLKDSRLMTAKKGYFISVAATRGERLFEGAMLTMKYFFDAAGYQPAGEILVKGVDGKAAIRNKKEYLLAAGRLGEEAAQS